MMVPIWGHSNGLKRRNKPSLFWLSFFHLFMIDIFKWIVIFVLYLLITEVPATAQKKYSIIFYNVENLFDIWDDPETSDEEFLPESQRHWTKRRFEDKIIMIYKALITAGDGECPDIIGLAEVENLWVIEQLIRRTPLNKVPYGIIHKESPDPRGIDVALLFRKDRLKPIDYEFIPVSQQGKYGFVSRDILHFTAEVEDEKIHFFVNHWPSRSGGYTETREKRNITAGILRKSIDSLLNKNREENILVMGDFNATQNEKCFSAILKTYPCPGNNNPLSLINLSTHWTKYADGTIRNGGQWEIFDQIICSPHFLKNETLRIDPEQKGICNFEFLLESDPTFLGKKPFRTYMGPIYHGGISDHLPVRIYITSNPSIKKP